VLGLTAFRGGFRTAALGTVLHVVIALAWALVFTFLYRRWPRAFNEHWRILRASLSPAPPLALPCGS